MKTDRRCCWSCRKERASGAMRCHFSRKILQREVYGGPWRREWSRPVAFCLVAWWPDPPCCCFERILIARARFSWSDLSLPACLPACCGVNNGVQIKQRERKRGAEKERVSGNKVKTLVFVFVFVLGGKAGWPVWSLTESNFEHPFKIPAKPHPFLYLQIQS